MRIHCPYCGERDSLEFTYLGDASARRPVPSGLEDRARFFEAVYLRENPAGPHNELWYHLWGCRGWLQVTRDTCTHEIFSVKSVSQMIHL
jgi:sarcosine oxidase subunit delta